MLGPDQEIVSVEKNVCVREEEVLLVNGTPITLEGEEGKAIKDCLLKGSIPNQDLINHLLLKAGLLRQPVKVQTELNVKSSNTQAENIFLHKNGQILDENCSQRTEVKEYTSRAEEAWQPNQSSSEDEGDDDDIKESHRHSTPAGPRDTVDRSRSRASEAGKLLKDRLMSTDSDSGFEKYDNLCAKNANSQESLDISFDSVFNKTTDTASVCSMSSDRSKSPGVQWREGVVVSGSLEDLIHELVPRAHTTPSSSFSFSFLLSSRLYLTPSQLLAEICRRAEQLSLMMSQESIPSFVFHLVQMLSNWVTWFPYDFQEESMRSKVRKLSQLCTSLDSSVQTRLTQLLQSLLKHLTAVEKHKQYVSKLRRIQLDGEKTGFPEDLTSPPDPIVVAQQLTHIELQYLSFVGPDEFVNAFARDLANPSSKSDPDLESGNLSVHELQPEAVEARLRAAKKTPNLESYISWFNRLTQLTASTVCVPKRKKHRVKVIEFWTEVARECVNIGNFNSMMGIISGLNLQPVSRLRKTWNRIRLEKFDVLGHQMDPSSNFVSYRTTLQAAVHRSENATDKKQRVIIPFFSLLLKDLYFLNEGCANKLSNGHINMEKARSLAEHVSQFMKWKDMDSPYEKSTRILDFLERSATFSKDRLEFQSYLLEPPESHQDKLIYKSLKPTFKHSS